MKPNYNGNKKRREEAKKKWQEQKRDKKLKKKHEAAQHSNPSEAAPSVADIPSEQLPPTESQQG